MIDLRQKEKWEEYYRRFFWLGYVDALLLSYFGMYFAAVWWACLTYVGKAVIDVTPDLGNDFEWYAWVASAVMLFILVIGAIPATLFDFIQLRPYGL
jgi:hypothetical protein